jgi:D-lyxose ketol-isomerase
MKRSVLNQHIANAAEFFAKNHFVLPPFAFWTPAQWRSPDTEITELRAQRLGWDITDFNSGDFSALGLTMFTLRNGLSSSPSNAKPYAEKIMLVRDRQVTPYHYHAQKMEDIINRGGEKGGRLLVQVCRSTNDGKLSNEPFTVLCDGIMRNMEPKGEVILGPGESITLPPFLYHTFYAIDGDALIGEVSSTNDDDTDNYFYEPIGRYPEIDEDESPLRLLCTEYRL